MPSIGVDAATGRVLVGWPHVAQSISKILETDLGTRVQLRNFGSLIPRILDKPQNEEELVNFYMSTAEALAARKENGRIMGEPRFGLDRVRLTADVPGEVAILLAGQYFPRGHLGDFSKESPQEITYSVTRLSDVLTFKAVG